MISLARPLTTNMGWPLGSLTTPMSRQTTFCVKPVPMALTKASLAAKRAAKCCSGRGREAPSRLYVRVGHKLASPEGMVARIAPPMRFADTELDETPGVLVRPIRRSLRGR